MLTVEAVLSLVPFILVILGIISFINIFALHNKIQYALYQMGNELSGYTYFYEALGVRSADLGLKKDISTQTEQLDGAIGDFQNFMEQIGKFEDSLNGLSGGSQGVQGAVSQGQAVVGQGQKLAESASPFIRDPMALVRGFIYLGIEKAEHAAKSFLIELISNGLMEVYLDGSFSGHNAMTADEYLRYYGVKDGMSGLDFGKSELFCDKNYRMIDLVVEYDVEIFFFKLFLKDPTIHVIQRCSIPAWLNGDGVTYNK